MNGLKRLYRGFRNSLESGSISLNDPRAFAEVFGWRTSETGIVVTPDLAIGHAPIWRAVNLICNYFAILPLCLMEREDDGDVHRAKAHPHYRLLRHQSNPYMKSGDLLKTLAYHAMFRGNGYALIIRNGAGNATRLLLLNPETTRPFQSNGSLWYAVQAGEEKRKVPAEDVLHVHGLGFDGLIGYDVVTLLANAMAPGLAARKFTSAFYANGAKAGGILMMPKGMSESAAKRVQEDFNKRTSVDESFKTTLLEEGIKYQQITVCPEQAQLLEVMQFESVQVALIFGIPPHKLGDMSRSSYNSLEQENRAFLQEGLDPLLCSVESEADAKLLTDEERFDEQRFFRFDRSLLMQTDSASTNAMQLARFSGGIQSRDETRQALNMEIIGGELGGQFNLLPGAKVATTSGDDGDPPDDPPEPDGDPLPPTDDPKMTNALRQLLAGHLARFANIDRNKAMAAAKSGGNYVSWADTWYAQQAERVAEAVGPVLLAIRTHQGRDCTDADSIALSNRYCERSKSIALAAAEVPRDQFQQSVESAFIDLAWVDDITESIMEAQ